MVNRVFEIEHLIELTEVGIGDKTDEGLLLLSRYSDWDVPYVHIDLIFQDVDKKCFASSYFVPSVEGDSERPFFHIYDEWLRCDQVRWVDLYNRYMSKTEIQQKRLLHIFPL